MPAGTTDGRAGALVQFYRYVFGIGHERNVGGTERTIRYALGVASVLAGIAVGAFPVLPGSVEPLILALALVASGVYLIYEAQVQYCPLNNTFGRSTYREE